MKMKKKFGWNQQRIDRVYSLLADAHKQLGNKSHPLIEDKEKAEIDDIQAGLSDLLSLVEHQKAKESKKEIAEKKETEAIYLKFCNIQARELCAITGEIFKTEIPLAFFLNNDYGLPVTPETAFKRGFIMSSMDFKKLETVVLRNICNDTNGRPNNMLTVNLSLPVCMKIWMGLDELFKILEMKTEGPKTSLCELYDLGRQIENVIFSVLRSTKEIQHQPIVIKEQPPVDYPEQVSEVPF